jgi:hypothetical protein
VTTEFHRDNSLPEGNLLLWGHYVAEAGRALTEPA